MSDLNKPHSKVFPPLSERLEETCKNLNLVGLDSKSFIQGMLTCTDSIIARRRGSWGTEKGWVSTKEVLEGFKALICKDRTSGKERWAWFILKEVCSFFGFLSICVLMFSLANDKAKEIVIGENLPSGDPPHGMFHSSKNITHDFFSQEEEHRRDSLVAMHMPFLHLLVSAKLEHARDIRQKERLKKNVMKQNVGKEDIYLGDPEIDAVNPVEDTKGIKDFESTTVVGQSNQQLEEHRIKKVCSNSIGSNYLYPTYDTFSPLFNVHTASHNVVFNASFCLQSPTLWLTASKFNHFSRVWSHTEGQ